MPIFKYKPNFSDICFYLWEGDTLESLQEMGSSLNLKQFQTYLKENNMALEEAIAINQYSVNSNITLGLARKTATVEQIKENIFKDMKESYKKTIIPEELDNVCQMGRDFLENVDFSQPVKDIKKEAMNFAKTNGFNYEPLLKSIEDLMHLNQAPELNKQLTSILDRYKLEEDTVLYRAVKSSYLPKKPEEMIGETIKNEYATSTTYDAKGGFIQNKEMDLVFQINVPKGTKGLDIEQLSSFRKEKEVLLGGHMLKINDYRYNGDKTILMCDLLPLEKEQKKEESIDDIRLDIPLERPKSIFVKEKEDVSLFNEKMDLMD